MRHSCKWPTISDFLEYSFANRRLQPDEQRTFDRYYAKYQRTFSKYTRAHYNSQTRELFKLMALADTAAEPSILEVGSGCGTESLWFALNGAQVTSLDVSEKRLRVARARQKIVEEEIGKSLKVDFRNQSFLDLGPDKQFDFIWMEQTFHHLEPRRAVYPAIAKALKPGGHVVIAEANGWNLLVQAQLVGVRGFKTKTVKTATDGTIIEYGNERITIPSVISQGLRKVGLETKQVRYFRMLPNGDWPDGVRTIEDSVPRPFRSLMTTHYNIVCQKPPL